MWARTGGGKEVKKILWKFSQQYETYFSNFLTANLTTGTSIGTMNLVTVTQTSCFPSGQLPLRAYVVHILT